MKASNIQDTKRQATTTPDSSRERALYTVSWFLHGTRPLSNNSVYNNAAWEVRHANAGL
ncbi:MAG: hypothetical protein OEZ43_12630 [Gammaproteobacteria bacterium]|nr:hypothetical protein [Gammaproteobacteria bacterium]